jgi:hypothetical protein
MINSVKNIQPNTKIKIELSQKITIISGNLLLRDSIRKIFSLSVGDSEVPF